MDKATQKLANPQNDKKLIKRSLAASELYFAKIYQLLNYTVVKTTEPSYSSILDSLSVYYYSLYSTIYT